MKFFRRKQQDMPAPPPESLLPRSIPGPTVTIPAAALETLLCACSSEAAHFALCGRPRGRFVHPGDQFGKIVGWMWLDGRKERVALLVADYLAEMRIHNPSAPEEGQRLTWSELRRKLPLSIPNLTEDQIPELLDYLDIYVPRFYGGDIQTP